MSLTWETKSDYNSKWVIGALAEGKRMWGFEENSVYKCLFTCWPDIPKSKNKKQI